MRPGGEQVFERENAPKFAQTQSIGITAQRQDEEFCSFCAKLFKTELVRKQPFRLYDLRHTWATRAAMSGIDLVRLAAMLEHSRIQMVFRYAHPTQQHQAQALRRLELSSVNKRSPLQSRLTRLLHKLFQ